MGVSEWLGGPPDRGRVQQPGASRGVGGMEEDAGGMRGQWVWADT